MGGKMVGVPGMTGLIDQSAFERLLKPAEVAFILQVSRTQVYRLLSNGELPGLHFGGKTVRVRKADLQAFIQGKNGQQNQMPIIYSEIPGDNR
jgi:excisionase family DNA binding protein